MEYSFTPTYRPNRQNGRHENGQNYLVNTGTVERLLACVPDDHSPVVDHRGDRPGDGAVAGEATRSVRPAVRTGLPRAQASGEAPRRRREPTLSPDHRHAAPHPAFAGLDTCRAAGAVGGGQTPRWCRRCDDDDSPVVAVGPIRPARSGTGVSFRTTADSRRRCPVDAAAGIAASGLGSRRRYTSFVHAVFTSKGRGIAAILRRVGRGDGGGGGDRRGGRRGRGRGGVDGAVDVAMREAGVSGAALPKDLAADQWVTLFNRLG